MAIKFLHLICLTFLIFLVIAPNGLAKRNNPSAKISSFDFIKKLEGCHKGNNTKEIHLLKAYLEKFGYLNTSNVNDDEFDETLDEAVKAYQKNFHIKPSGIVDDETISKMTRPRCGVPDMANGTNYMEPRQKKHEGSIHTVAHFTFFPQNPRWPLSKTHLTYRFSPNFPSLAVDPVARAFQQWDAATRFSFSRAGSNQNSDLVIGWVRGDHGDGFPFDGPGDTLAHAFAPTNGRFHYDADEPWSVAPIANAFHLETLAVHEIGHLLGLDHSADEAAIMYPTFSLGEVKKVGQDDINGIAALYSL